MSGGNTNQAPGRERVRPLIEQGRTPREIAAALGISTQRVYQILRDLRLEDQGEES